MIASSRTRSAVCQLVDDRRLLQKFVFPRTDSSKSHYLPVNLHRIVQNAIQIYSHLHRPMFLSRRLQVRRLRLVHRRMHPTSPARLLSNRSAMLFPPRDLSLQRSPRYKPQSPSSAEHLSATHQPVRLSVPHPHTVCFSFFLTLYHVLNTPHVTDFSEQVLFQS